MEHRVAFAVNTKVCLWSGTLVRNVCGASSSKRSETGFCRYSCSCDQCTCLIMRPVKLRSLVAPVLLYDVYRRARHSSSVLRELHGLKLVFRTSHLCPYIFSSLQQLLVSSRSRAPHLDIMWMLIFASHVSVNRLGAHCWFREASLVFLSSCLCKKRCCMLKYVHTVNIVRRSLSYANTLKVLNWCNKCLSMAQLEGA